MSVPRRFFAETPGSDAASARPAPALRGLGLASLLAAASAPHALHAQSASFSGEAALSSQLVDRGQPVTTATPVLQAAGNVTFATAGSGWSLGVSGSAEARSPGRLAEALAQVSRFWTLSDAWQMQAELLYYSYPSSHASSQVYDRSELALGWSYRDILSFGLSAIHATHSDDHRLRGAADLDLRWPLARGFSLSAGAGIAQAPAWPYGYDHANRYGYGHAGLMWDNGPWRLELARVVVSNRQVRDGEGRPSLAPWVATLSWAF